MSKRLLFVVSEDWYFVSHRLHLAVSAIDAGYKVALLSRVTSHRKIVEEAGIQVIDWSFSRRSRNPLKELVAVFGLFAAIRKFRPDVVHAVAIKPVIYAASVCRLTRVKSRVYALGGLGFIFSAQQRAASTFRSAIVFAFRVLLRGKKSLMILQNPDDKSILLSTRAISEDRIRMIRGAGVDTNLFSPEPMPAGTPLVILPSRMLWEKGVMEFVECAREMKNDGLDVRFALVGEPDQHNPGAVPEEQLHKWAEEGVVEWWGRCSNMQDVFNQSTVVCLPSTYGEGLPKALMEASSCARPIVSYDVPGCREAVINNVNGFLVPKLDGLAMREAIEMLLGDPELCTRFGNSGRELVINEFSQERVAAETLLVWEEVLS